MPKKTLYIKDVDIDIWDEAKKLAIKKGVSLSRLISLLIKKDLEDGSHGK